MRKQCCLVDLLARPVEMTRVLFACIHINSTITDMCHFVCTISNIVSSSQLYKLLELSIKQCCIIYSIQIEAYCVGSRTDHWNFVIGVYYLSVRQSYYDCLWKFECNKSAFLLLSTALVAAGSLFHNTIINTAITKIITAVFGIFTQTTFFSIYQKFSYSIRNA